MVEVKADMEGLLRILAFQVIYPSSCTIAHASELTDEI